MTALGSTFETNEPGLADLLKEVETGVIQLPDFQRPWVWEDRRIRALVASLSLSYPIGAVMMMVVGDDTRFAPRPVEGTALTPPLPKPKKLILDGQQRLTSLYCALRSNRPVRTRTDKGQEISRWYYIDMKRALAEGVDHEDRFEAVRSIPADKKLKSDFDRVVDLDLSSADLEYHHHMFPLSLMFDDVKADGWFEGYVEKHGFTKENNQFVGRFRREVRDAFRLFRVPVIELLEGTRKEAVCQVFENVNMGGVPLTVFELVTATFAADDFRLRDEWEARRTKGVPSAHLQSFSKHDVISRVSGESFLQAVTLYSTYVRHEETQRSAVGAKRKDILRLTLPEYKAHADKVHAGFLDAARLLIREKVFTDRNLPYDSQLVPLATICAILGDAADSDAVKKKVARWYWSGVFGELYGGANEGRFALDVQEVPKWLGGGEEPRTIRDASFVPTRLLTMQSRLSAAYKGVMELLMDLGSLDLKTGDPIHLTSHMEDGVDIHHIFPADYCEKQGYDKRRWNSVVNKTPLTARTNRSIGGRAPSVYLTPIDKDLGAARVDQILATHGIAPGTLRADDFSKFMQTRASVLLDLIERSTGKVVPGRDSEETLEAFGGSLLSPVA